MSPPLRWPVLLLALVVASPFASAQAQTPLPNPVDRGAVLFSELGCASCHGADPVAVLRRAPSLKDISRRVERTWVDRFLAGQERTQGTSLYQHQIEDPAERNALLHWLAASAPGPKLKVQRHANAVRGKQLFAESGCVACHDPDLSLVGKTQVSELGHTLQHASLYYPDGRMPDLSLDPRDTLNIAAYLVRLSESDPRTAARIKAWPAVDTAAAKTGKALADQQGCLNCHSPKRPAQALMSIERESAGCMDAEHPRYSLRERDRADLKQYLASEFKGFDLTGLRTLNAMGCLACHQRDGLGGPSDGTLAAFAGNVSLGDSGRLPPPLTGIGHKLKRGWLERVLRGDPETRLRPYLKTQMPHYPAHAAALADWLVKIDAPKKAPSELAEQPRVEAGKMLMGNQGGAGCVTCHGFQNRASLGIPALDLSRTTERLQPTWFREYMLHPGGYRPGTLMPALWPDGASAWPNIAGGDTEKQLASLWAYLAEPDELPPGLSGKAGTYELVPTDRPIIQRSFFKEVGTHAILVGYPDGIHLAYDAERAAPALLWKGRFFDAYGTWFSRFAPFGEPLDGKDSEQRAFEKPERAGTSLGYLIDKNGNPTFLSKQTVEGGEVRVEDRIAVRGNLIERHLSWNGQLPDIAHPSKLPRTLVAKTEQSRHWRYTWNALGKALEK